MSIATVVTEGFGSFGTIGHVIRDGFDGSTVPPPEPEVEEVFRSGGKGDNKKRRRIIKPTGLPPYKEARKTVEERVEETREIHQEVRGALEEAVEAKAPVEQVMDITMPPLPSGDELVAELSYLLKKKMRTDEEEAMLVILLAADL